jgi:hypothetical protein
MVHYIGPDVRCTPTIASCCSAQSGVDYDEIRRQPLYIVERAVNMALRNSRGHDQTNGTVSVQAQTHMHGIFK